MIEVKPFKGYLYNPAQVESISSVIAPPWDIIDAADEKKLISSSEWNIIKLISRKILPSEADSLFQKWIKEKILIKDASDSFYFLRHKFSCGGKTFERKGIFALLKIDGFENGNVIPHEHVFEKHHTNRYRLIEKCLANFSPVFMLYRDKEKKIEKTIDKTPVLREGMLKDDSLKFGRIDSKKEIRAITEILNPGKLLIADGHHRHQAAYRFYQDNPQEKNSYVLVFLSNLESSGLIILPTHRYIPYRVSFRDNLASFERYFSVEKAGSREDMYKRMSDNFAKHAFGIFEKGVFYAITLKDSCIMQEYKHLNYSEEWLSLDNVILKNIILEKVLNLGEKEILYHASEEYLLEEYGRKKDGFIVFVNPVSKEKFLKISLNNEKMPQKTTYFYPKVPTGLVIHKF